MNGGLFRSLPLLAAPQGHHPLLLGSQAPQAVFLFYTYLYVQDFPVFPRSDIDISVFINSSHRCPFSPSFVYTIFFEVLYRLIEIYRLLILHSFLVTLLLVVRLTVFCAFPGHSYCCFPVPLPQFCSRLCRVWVGLCWSRARLALGEPAWIAWASRFRASFSSAHHSLPGCPRLPPAPSKTFPRGHKPARKEKAVPPASGKEGVVSGLSWVGRGFHAWLGTLGFDPGVWYPLPRTSL